MADKAEELLRTAAHRHIDNHYHSMWDEETSEALNEYLWAEKAEAEGHPEVAAILRETARDELKHALWMGVVARKRELDSRSLADYIRGSMGGDNNVVAREREIAAMARLLGREADAARFEQMAQDELDHVEKYKKALELLERGKS